MDGEPVHFATPAISLTTDFGADGIILDYADQRHVIFHSSIGLFVYDRKSADIIRAIDLKPLGCHWTQGDNYCEVMVEQNGTYIFLHPILHSYMLVYDIQNNEMIKTDFSLEGIAVFKGLIHPEEYSPAGKGFASDAVYIQSSEGSDYYVYLTTEDCTPGTLLCWSNAGGVTVFDDVSKIKKSAYMRSITGDTEISPSIPLDTVHNIWLE